MPQTISYDMRGLRTGDPLLTVFLYGLGHIQHPATPFYTSMGVFCSIAGIGIFHLTKTFSSNARQQRSPYAMLYEKISYMVSTS